MSTSVLIVGAGPTGSMAANQLMRFGIDFIIIDPKEGPTLESRAIVVTARSLEIYQQMGLVDRVLEEGVRMERGYLFSGGKEKAEIRLGDFGKGQSEFPYLLAYEQSKNEALLAENLTEQGRTIHWEHELVELKEYKEGIDAVIQHQGTRSHIKARYLIACDGASSPVRKQLNFSFGGGTYKHKFFVADTTLEWDLDYSRLIIAPGDENFCAFMPLYGNRNYRIIGTLPKKYADREDIEFRDIDDVVAKTLGLKVNFETVNWFSIYKLHHRSVDQFREGNVFLAGDSAHIHSPAGGQGMNTGLQDAYNLCWKLALVLKGQARPELLDTYNEERLPFARWLLRFTDRGFKMMTSDHPITKRFRKHVILNVIGKLTKTRIVRKAMFKTISQIWYSYKGMSLSGSVSKQPLAFKAGDRLPYFPDNNIHPSFTKPAFHLLHIGQDPISNETKGKLRSLFPFEIEFVENELSADWKSLGVKQELFMLVRPDNHIAFIFDTIDGAQVKNYLNRYFLPME
ncbi:MAG: FAD-dependent monooxygenase [Flavobacteriales bacterium]